MEQKQDLKRKLEASDEEERLQALRAVAGLAPETALELLLSRLGDESWRVRKEAAELFLGYPGASSLASEVVDLLHEQENAGLRNAAVEILIRLGRQALPQLLQEVSCNDPDVRKFVLDILGEIGDPDSVSTMLTRMGDEDPNVRAAAVENLGKIGAEEAVPAMLDALQDSDLFFRFTLLEALGRIGAAVPVDRLLAFRDDALLRKALFDCLGCIGSVEAVPTLVAGIGDRMRNVRAAAVVALERIARAAPEDVRRELEGQTGELPARTAELLKDANRDVRLAAVRLLGWMGDGEQAAELVGLFAEEELQEPVALTLIRMGPRAWSSLLRLWPDQDPRTRACLAYVFGESGCVEAVESLLQALGAPEPELRMMAARALGKLQVSRALTPLIALLEDPAEEVQQAASDALLHVARRRREEALGELQPLLEDEDPMLRMNVVNVLGKLDGSESRQVIGLALKDDSPLVRAAAVRNCRNQVGADQWEALRLALTDEDAEVRRLAAETLGTCGNPEASTALELGLNDEDPWVRAAAVRALGELGGEQCRPLLIRTLADEVGLVVITALETLYEIAPGEAFAHLCQALEHGDEEVVNAALHLLARSGRRDWIDRVGEALLNHPHWEVRVNFARTVAALQGRDGAHLLEERLLVEGEDLVRRQLQELLGQLLAKDE